MVPTVLSRLLFPVTTGAQENEEGDDEENGDSGQTSPQGDLHLSAAQQTPRGPHGRSRHWYQPRESVSPSEVATWGQRAACLEEMFVPKSIPNSGNVFPLKCRGETSLFFLGFEITVSQQ